MVLAVPLPDTFSYYDEMWDLVEFLEGERVPFVDVSPALKDGAGRGLTIHYAGDRHWTADGHRLAARAIHESLGGGLIAGE